MSKMTKRLLILVALIFGPLAALGDEIHTGVATCASSQCHGSAVARDGSKVLQNEYVTWTQSDPHAGAYDTLSSDESRAIARRLGLNSASTSDICLDCHSDNVASSDRGERFQLSDGVGCEACHGGAQDWLSTHYNTPTVDHAANIAAGMRALDEPAIRAAVCLSCHLGTDDQFATHTIMAAGHPRLSFELDTFTELWRTAGRQPHYRADADYQERKTLSSHLYTWFIGLVADASLRLSLIDSELFTGENMFPELGLYDCHACHRSMKSVQWRPLARHANSGPGVPFISDGSFVMLLAVAETITPATADAMRDTLGELHVAASQSVADIRAAAAILDEEIQTLRRSASEDLLWRHRQDILTALLSFGASGQYVDYASAEQAFMAVQMLAFELGDSELQAELGALADRLDDDERYSVSQFALLLRGLQQEE